MSDEYTDSTAIYLLRDVGGRRYSGVLRQETDSHYWLSLNVCPERPLKTGAESIKRIHSIGYLASVKDVHHLFDQFIRDCQARLNDGAMVDKH